MNIAEMIQRSKQDLDLTYNAGISKGIEMGSGGGLPAGIISLDTGTYTCTTAPSSTIEISHKLGVRPNFVFLYAEGSSLKHTDFYYFITHQFGFAQPYTGTVQAGEAFRVVRYGNSNGFSQLNSTLPGINSFATDKVFYSYNSATYQLKPGITYHWIVGVIET